HRAGGRPRGGARGARHLGPGHGRAAADPARVLDGWRRAHAPRSDQRRHAQPQAARPVRAPAAVAGVPAPLNALARGDIMAITRRRFLSRSGLVAAGSVLAPSLFAHPLVRRAFADTIGDRYFVVIYLDGGNDGLNTVSPIDDGSSFNLRAAYE